MRPFFSFLSLLALLIYNTSFSQVSSDYGTPFAVNNVLWKLNPFNPGKAILLTYNYPGTTGTTSYVGQPHMLMIENGVYNGGGSTPKKSFKFISVNLTTNEHKVIPIKKNGVIVTESVGRIVRYVTGSNHKFYICTEGGGSNGTGGGHLIEYDPNPIADPSQPTATDIGTPFGSGFNIYSLNIGTDGKLYGGSFGMGETLKVFCYDYTATPPVVYVVQDPPANSNLDLPTYVSYVSGNANYIHAACGENKWILYKVEKSSTTVTTVISGTQSNGQRIQLNPRIDYNVNNTPQEFVYASMGSLRYQLKDDGTHTILATGYPQPSEDKAYKWYDDVEEANKYNIKWDEFAGRKLTYQFPQNALPYKLKDLSINNDVVLDTLPTGQTTYFKNEIYMGSPGHPHFAKYSNTENKWKILGKAAVANIYGLANDGVNTIYMGCYPQGDLLSYEPFNDANEREWTLTEDVLLEPCTTSCTNPFVKSQLHLADEAQRTGPIKVEQLLMNRDNVLIGVGDDDRITSDGQSQLAICKYAGGTKTNINIEVSAYGNKNPYQYVGMCLDNEKKNVFISAKYKDGLTGFTGSKILKYDVTTGSLVGDGWDLPYNNPGKIIMLNSRTIAGFYQDIFYVYDLVKGTGTTPGIIYTEVLLSSKNIHAIQKASDGSILLIDNSSAVHFQVRKFKFDVSYCDNVATVPSTRLIDRVETLVDTIEAPDEDTKPTFLTIVPSNDAPGNYDLYITGLKTVHRYKNIIVPATETN